MTSPMQPPPLEMEAPTRRRPRALDALIEIATTVALAIVLYVVIQTFVVQTYRVEQQSMQATLQPNQHLLIDKLTPRFDDYSRGDIIVFHPPPDAGEGDTPYIKRVIAVGGEHVQIKGGAVWVNDAKLDEPYVKGGDTDADGDQSTWDVPQGALFVLGDHRNASTDSRVFGFVAVDSVIGRAWLRFWPLTTLTLLQTPTYANVSASAP